MKNHEESKHEITKNDEKGNTKESKCFDATVKIETVNEDKSDDIPE